MGLVALTAFGFNQLADCSRLRRFHDLTVTSCQLGTLPLQTKDYLSQALLQLGLVT